MAEVRFWQMSDLPFMRWFAAVNAWEILPPDDKQVAAVGTVVQSAEQNLFRVLNAPGGTALVAVDQGRPVGYMLIAVQPDDKTGEPVGYMADVYIEAGYRKQGIGGRFHELGEGYLAGLGIRRATLWTHATNPLGQKSATKRGYNLRAMMMSRQLQA